MIGLSNDTFAWAACTAAALAATAAAWLWRRSEAAEKGSWGSSCVCRSTVDGLDGFDVGGLEVRCAKSLFVPCDGDAGIMLLI